MPSLVEIGLTDLPKTGGGQPPACDGPVLENDFNQLPN